ncbi:MAG TPA: hypothetical protein EYP28_00325 [Methanophagales archaeon]|nr:hypothetical protein [Methanophagales archaeon]
MSLPVTPLVCAANADAVRVTYIVRSGAILKDGNVIVPSLSVMFQPLILIERAPRLVIAMYSSSSSFVAVFG